MKQYKAVKNYVGYAFAVVDVYTGEIVECDHESWADAKKSAKNFNDWN